MFSSSVGYSPIPFICIVSDLITFKVKDWVVFGRNRFKPPFKISDALINEARIVHVVHGRSSLYAADHFINLKAGDTIVMKADNFVNNWLENDNDALNEVIAFQLNAKFLKHLYGNQLPSWFVSKNDPASKAAEKVNPHPLVTEYFKNLGSYVENRNLLSEEVIQIKIRELLSLLIETDHSGSIRSIFGNLFAASDYDFQEVIQTKLFENLGIEELAFLSGLSVSSFKRKFQNIYGTSPNKYITSKRLEKAQVLLKSSDLSISEIAYDCGFNDVGYFSKVFKTHYNCLPSDLRK